MSRQHESLRTQYTGGQYTGGHSLTANVWASLHIPKGNTPPVHYNQPPRQTQQRHYVGKKWGGCMKLLLFGLLALMVLGGIAAAIGAVS